MVAPSTHLKRTADRSPSRATITLTSGATYVADTARWSGWTLIFTGRRRVRNLSGERYYATREYRVPRSRIRRLDWHREAA